MSEQGNLFDHVPEQSPIVIESLPVSPARSTDPETAHAAAEAAPEMRGAQRIDVFNFYKSQGKRGATDYETGKSLGILRTSAGKRRKELCEAGLIIETEERRETDTGSTAIVWRIASLDDSKSH